MLKITFTNAVVEDDGYGVSVNGQTLEKIISTALGTRVGEVGGYGSPLPKFRSNSCDVIVIINPHKVGEEIETDEEVFNAVKELEECRYEQYKEKIGEAES